MISNEMVAMRINKNGDIVWNKTYLTGYASGIAKTNDGNYLIGGTSLIKININGDTLWTRRGVKGDNFKFTNDGGFYFCGGVFVSGRVNPNLRKFDSLGYLQWEKTYNNFFDGLFSDLIVDQNNNLTLIGNYSVSNPILENPFIMKTDSHGQTIWFHGYNSDSLNYYYISQIQKKNNGDLIVGGSNNLNCYFMHFDSTGFMKRLNYIDSNVYSVQLYSLIKTVDNGFAFTGYFYQDSNFCVELVKTDSGGNEEWRKLYFNGISNVGYCVKGTQDSGYAIIGKREINSQSDIYIIKTDKYGFANPPVYVNTVSNSIPKDFVLYQNYPNPFNPVTKINFEINKKSFVNLTIYNSLGQEITTPLSRELLPGKYSLKINFENLNISSGIYFYTMKSNDVLSTRKMLYVK